MSSALTRIISATYLLRIPHLIRMLMNSIILGFGFLLIIISTFYYQQDFLFYVALLSACFFGTVTALGESTILGFCKGFPSSYVGCFSSGTGFAGIFGSGLLLLLKGFGISLGEIFLFAMPFIVVYFYSFYYLHHTQKKAECMYRLPLSSRCLDST